MKKYYRILIPTFANILFGTLLLYLITQYVHDIDTRSIFIKTLSLVTISIVIMFAMLLIRGFFDIIFYVPIYWVFATLFLSYTSYKEINFSIPTLLELTIPVTLLLTLSSIFPELYRRYKVKRLARSCIKGERLTRFSKTPWRLFDETPKDQICTLYFDIPELYGCQSVLSTRELKDLIDTIFTKNFRTIEKYSGTLIRSTEDSMLIAFELLDQKNIKIPMEPKVYCAYSALICALELRQNLEEIKESLTKESPLLKRLKGRSGVGSDGGLILKHIRNGRLELSLFTNSMNNIAAMLKQSTGNDIICDLRTYELCSEYFSAKKIENNAYSIIGLSN